MWKRKIKAAELVVEQPLPHRPGVVKVTLPDGRSRVFGDSAPYSSRELVALSDLAQSTTAPLKYTAEERAEASARVGCPTGSDPELVERF